MAENIQEILKEREKTHGDFSEHAIITQAIKSCYKITDSYDRLSSPQREALDMIAHKIGRILAGNPYIKDHWDDIAGYATLVSERIEDDNIPG